MTTYLPLDVTSGQRKNLETLYTFLGILPPEEFHMAEYAVPLGEDPETAESINLDEMRDTTCSTICCMMGSGPKAGIDPTGYAYWKTYGHGEFGAVPKFHTRSEAANAVWDWLFSNDWTYVDNTIAGGRARLRLALDQGIPADYRAQLYEDAPYIFAELANG